MASNVLWNPDNSGVVASGTTENGILRFPNLKSKPSEECEVQVSNGYLLVLSKSHMIFQHNSGPSALAYLTQPFVVELKSYGYLTAPVGQGMPTSAFKQRVTPLNAHVFRF